jgi:hypothetical protein
MGIEPTSEAWEASILPLYDARSLTKLANDASARKRCQVGQSAAPAQAYTLYCNSLYLWHPTRWSFTRPVACMNA